MKRTFAAVITAVMAGTAIWLAAAPAAPADAAHAAYAAYAKSKPPPLPYATIQVVPKWTYRNGGKLAVIATCSQRRDIRVITSKMFRHPVIMRKGGKLLIKVTKKTNAGQYTMALWCVGPHGQVDALDVKSVKILKRLGHFKQPVPPALPKRFKANVTVQSGPPAPAHGKKKGH
jgi:hypothetical protein